MYLDRRSNRFEPIDKHDIFHTFNAYKNRGARHVHQHDSFHEGSRNLPDLPNSIKCHSYCQGSQF